MEARVQAWCVRVEELRKLLVDAGGSLDALEAAQASTEVLLGELHATGMKLALARKSREKNGGAVERRANLEIVRRCAECGAVLLIKHRRADQEPFWGCSNYPGCKYSAPCSQGEAKRYREQQG